MVSSLYLGSLNADPSAGLLCVALSYTRAPSARERCFSITIVASKSLPPHFIPAHLECVRLDIVIHETTPGRMMIWSRVHVPTVRTFAVGLLVQLERGVGTDVLDVLVALCLVAARFCPTATHTIIGRVATHCQILVPVCLGRCG